MSRKPRFTFTGVVQRIAERGKAFQMLVDGQPKAVACSQHESEMLNVGDRVSIVATAEFNPKAGAYYDASSVTIIAQLAA